MKLIPVFIENIKDVPVKVTSLNPRDAVNGFSETAKLLAKEVVQWINSSECATQVNFFSAKCVYCLMAGIV